MQGILVSQRWTRSWFFPLYQPPLPTPILDCLTVYLKIHVSSLVFILTCVTNLVKFPHEHHSSNIYPWGKGWKHNLLSQLKATLRLLGTSQCKILCHLPAFCPPRSQISLETKVLILRYTLPHLENPPSTTLESYLITTLTVLENSQTLPDLLCLRANLLLTLLAENKCSTEL